MYSRSTPTSVLAILFDLALDGAREVESPGLLPSMKAQALERYRKLSAPALLGATRSYKPDTIPLFVDWAVFDDKGINERAQRIGGEVEGISPIAKRVDDNLDAIVGRKIGITRHLRADDTPRV